MRTGWSVPLVGALVLAACTAPERSGDTDAAGEPAADAAPDAVVFVDAAPTDPIADAGSDHCGDLTAIYRDFKQAHPDFEDTLGDDRGLVEDVLGADGKPVYALAGASATVSGPA